MILQGHLKSKVTDKESSQLTDALFSSIKVNSQSIAIEYNDKKITYRNLNEQILLISEALRLFEKPFYRANSHVLKAETANCIGLYMNNSPNWIVCDLALLKCKKCCAPIPKFFSNQQIEHLLTNALIHYVISDCLLDNNPAFIAFELVIKFNLNHETIYLYQRLFHHSDHYAPHKDSIKITYTSGTTSEPKGVMINSNSALDVTQSVNHVAGIRSKDRHLSLLPFTLLLENIVGIYGIFLAGATLVIPTDEALGRKGSSSYNISRLMSLINRHKISTMITVPALAKGMIEYCRQKKWKNNTLRFVAVGGAHCAESIIDQATKYNIPLYQGYGLSECTSVVSLNNHEHRKNNSVGKILPHVDIKIAEDGEILISGSLCDGYLHSNKPNETERIDGKPYWKSGDIGYIEDGFLYLIGRKKLSFCTAFGRNISPEWIEKELTAVTNIHHAIVYGEDREFNIAIVVISNTGSFNIYEAIRVINNRLPDYAKVAEIILIPSPLNVSRNQISMTGIINRQQILNDYQSQIEAIYALNKPYFLPLIQPGVL